MRKQRQAGSMGCKGKALTKGQANRIGYIDLAKGIAILLMVFCHVVEQPYILALAFSFHMPIFFIITGILLSGKKVYDRCSFKKNFIRKLRTIALPYLIATVIYCTLAAAWDVLVLNMDADLIRIVKSTIKYFAFGYHALWFLPAMFIANNLFYGFHSLLKCRVRLLLDCALLVATSMVARYIAGREQITVVNIIIFFNRALIGYLFIELGYYLVHAIDAVRKNFLKLVIAVICLGIYVYTSQLNIPDLHFSRIGKRLLYYFNAVIGSLGILLLCSWVDKIADIRLIKYYGRNSMTVLITHIIFAVFLKWLVLLMTIKYFGEVKYFELYYFIGICIAEVLIIKIFNLLRSAVRCWQVVSDS